MAKPRTDCPDCKGTLEPVRVLGSQPRGPNLSPGDVEVCYAPGQARSSWLTRRTKTSGILFGMRCSECGRVLLYGMERP